MQILLDLKLFVFIQIYKCGFQSVYRRAHERRELLSRIVKSFRWGRMKLGGVFYAVIIAHAVCGKFIRTRVISIKL